ncbi:hypothetical protein BS47DRAFT_84289 [Hydnum rufescens UP504]|uniref:PH domain-containing protein n=1 Tax=Hydnum rufescens UP504 TaxID=1448309 RepID=A0A9P6B7Q3_9AGAM|nr:hypothetical protein BS47DRAFT_84289 [Hydnum rufescens UP504]
MPRSVYSDVTTLSGLTTASTLSVHDTLPTPGDERSDPLSYGAAVSKHREFSRVTSALGSAEIFDSYQEASPYIHQTAPNIHIIHASSDDSLMPSVPPTPPPKSPTLAIHRRRSTKELISIYESTSSTPSLNYNTTTSEHPGQYESRNSARSKNQNPKILKTRPSNEGRWNPAAPMRYSFQNLLGVFGRKQRQPTKEFTVFRPPAKIPGLPLISTRPPTALTEGQLLYLCRTSSNAVSWKGCTAALHPPYLRLSFTQPLPGTPLTYSINMSLCVEVHSIGANKLDPSLVPIIAGHNDAHVFEMELEGGMKERFAAWSVKDRGSWVSKIWDIILSQNATDPGSINMATRSTSPVTINQRTDPPLRVINASHLSIVSGSTENRSSAFANASTDSEIPFPAKPSYPQTDLTPSENRFMSSSPNAPFLLPSLRVLLFRTLMIEASSSRG